MLDDKRYIHHMTGDGWKTYPTYDLTYCRCDNFQCITHSLCATEFDLSRVSYEWLCDRLAVPRLMLVLDPMVRVVIKKHPKDFMEMVELPFFKGPAYY
jgi:glutamyl/glutaminyl-tRNA synthetase